MKKATLITAFALFFALGGAACSSGDNSSFDLSKPFWEEGVMRCEPVIMVREAGADEADGYLMFTPKKLLKVQDQSLKITYKEGKDYRLEGNKLIRAEGSDMPFIDEEVLFGVNMPSGYNLGTQNASAAGRAYGYEKVLYTEGTFLIRNQLAVTYEYDTSDYTGYIQEYVGGKLPETMAKLKAGGDLSMVIYGDSISTGCNSTGGLYEGAYDDSLFTPYNIEPFTPSWPELTAAALNKKYGAAVTALSAAKGGQTSDWGKNNALTRAYNPDALCDPDLLVIAFGMNDGSVKMNAATFKSNIKIIIDSVRAASDKPVEFLLVGSMLCNPYAIQHGTQEDYFSVLSELSDETEGVAAVDAGGLHKAFLEQKRYCDLTANNINHPNDFVIRLYAMAIRAGLIG